MDGQQQLARTVTGAMLLAAVLAVIKGCAGWLNQNTVLLSQAVCVILEIIYLAARAAPCLINLRHCEPFAAQQDKTAAAGGLLFFLAAFSGAAVLLWHQVTWLGRDTGGGPAILLLALLCTLIDERLRRLFYRQGIEKRSALLLVLACSFRTHRNLMAVVMLATAAAALGLPFPAQLAALGIQVFILQKTLAIAMQALGELEPTRKGYNNNT